MEIGKWKLAQAWIHHPEPKDSRGVWDDLVKVANAEWEAKEQAFMGTITPEFDELSPKEEQYYHQIFMHYVLQDGERAHCAWDKAR